MNFELKQVDIIGGVKTIDINNSGQMLNIKVGIVGCPYMDIVANKIVQYSFPNTLSFQAVKDGITIFATTWVATNYPSVSGGTL